MKLSIHREPVLWPGGRPMDPRRLYLTLSLLGGFLTAFALGVYSLYVVRDAGLTPLQLVLAGTAREASAFAFEIPTGVVADAYSRRFSLVIGYVVFGLGIAIMGAVPTFAVIAGGQFVWGLGFTFLSGAREAWIADEIGEAEAAPVYLRAAQLRQVGLFLGTPLGFGLGFVSLQLPFLIGGAAFLLVAALVAYAMTEEGYRPAPAADRSTWASMARTLGEGARAIRGRGALIAAVVVALLLGTSSEAVDRLWSFHLIEGVGLPSGVSDVAIFAGIHTTDVVLGIAAVWLAQRMTDLERSRAITRSLLVFSAMTVVG
jgi:DHA3 family tetracycline resistance protein-like MFS transporter